MPNATTGEPIIYSADYWRIELSKVVLQLVQEVAALKPGLRIEADLNPIIQMASATPNRPKGQL